jgi:hypothetical protein
MPQPRWLLQLLRLTNNWLVGWLAGWLQSIASASGEDLWDNPRSANHTFITEHNGSKPLRRLPKVQGLVALVDSGEHDGGFITVPGFHKFVRQYALQTEIYCRSSFVGVQNDPEWIGYAQKITMRAGSIVVWDSQMPHCNFPNDSSNMRMCQYIKMFPRKMVNSPRHRAVALRRLLPAGLSLSHHQIKVFGLDVLEEFSAIADGQTYTIPAPTTTTTTCTSTADE